MCDELINRPDGEIGIPDERGKVLRIDHMTDNIDFRGVLAHLVQYADMSHIISTIERASQYVVDVPVRYQDALNKGLLEINQNAKTGTLWPTLVKRLENGKKEFVDNLPIRQESFVQGNPMHDLSSSMQSLYLQRQITELTQLVKDTYDAVLRIEEGQKDDRIGLLRSGYEGVQLALKHRGDQRQRELELAREQIREAKNRIGEVLKSRIQNFQPLSRNMLVRFIMLLRSSNYMKAKDKEFDTIQEYYSLYLRATQLLAESYILCHDEGTAEEVYNMSVDYVRGLDFSNVATIQYIHPKASVDDLFYLKVVEYFSAEKAVCLESAKAYDYVEVSASGEQILEAIRDARTEAFSEKEA